MTTEYENDNANADRIKSSFVAWENVKDWRESITDLTYGDYTPNDFKKLAEEKELTGEQLGKAHLTEMVQRSFNHDYRFNSFDIKTVGERLRSLERSEGFIFNIYGVISNAIYSADVFLKNYFADAKFTLDNGKRDLKLATQSLDRLRFLQYYKTSKEIEERVNTCCATMLDILYLAVIYYLKGKTVKSKSISDASLKREFTKELIRLALTEPAYKTSEKVTTSYYTFIKLKLADGLPQNIVKDFYAEFIDNADKSDRDTTAYYLADRLMYEHTISPILSAVPMLDYLTAMRRRDCRDLISFKDKTVTDLFFRVAELLGDFGDERYHVFKDLNLNKLYDLVNIKIKLSDFADTAFIKDNVPFDDVAQYKEIAEPLELPEPFFKGQGIDIADAMKNGYNIDNAESLDNLFTNARYLYIFSYAFRTLDRVYKTGLNTADCVQALYGDCIELRYRMERYNLAVHQYFIRLCLSTFNAEEKAERIRQIKYYFYAFDIEQLFLTDDEKLDLRVYLSDPEKIINGGVFSILRQILDNGQDTFKESMTDAEEEEEEDDD